MEPEPLPDKDAALAWFTAEHACLLAAQQLAERHLALGEHSRARTRWREALALYQAQFRDADGDRVRRRLGSFGS